MQQPLSANQLRRTTDPKALNFESVEKAEPIQSIIGQERAVSALKTGLGITAKGFNVYVAGQPGTGRLSAVDEFMEEFSKEVPAPEDWAYVNNFKDPYRPCALKFPTGKAREFKSDMHNLVEEVKSSLKKSFESEEFNKQREAIVQEMEKTQNEIFANLNQEAQKRGFQLQNTSTGTFAIPVNEEGKQMTDSEFAELGDKQQEELLQKQNEINDVIKDAARQARQKEKEINQKLEDLKQQTALNAIGMILQEVKEKYEDLGLKRVVTYLEDVKADILDNLDYFIKGKQQNQMQQLMQGAAGNNQGPSPTQNYEVNVLVDNAELGNAPVVIEQNPTYNNLFGKIEKESQFGTLTTDFTLIRQGAIHRANGGYLVIPVKDLLINPFAYESLKRTLVANEIEIEEISERLGYLSAKSIRPQPIPLKCKVVLVGTPMLYRLLYELDQDFRELFKVKADFDVSMDHQADNVDNYVRWISKLCQEEELMPLDSTGLARIIEHGSRLADDQEKLTTKFGELADILRESHFHASQNNHDHITGKDINTTIEAQHYRSNLIQEKIKESIERNTIFIDAEGEETGQVNGLAVLGLGDLTFGRPTRITVSTRLGKEGVIDIEREAKLGGNIHSKGVMILNGYLASTFGQDFPLSLSASIVFEQSYGEVDGDSASSTELYALLSSLAEVPIKQGIAVTGSVNQKGEVQAVGGINEKIEGYYEVCKAKGFNGEQGVMIPAANQKHLMIKKEVVEAVQNGDFNVWAVHHIDEGIEVLTGMKAGKKENGTFEADSVKARVYENLKAMAERMRDFGKGAKE